MKIAKQALTGGLVLTLIFAPLCSWASQWRYLGDTQSVADIQNVNTVYQYDSGDNGDNGHYLQAKTTTDAQHPQAQDFYLPVTLAVQSASHSVESLCHAGQLCARQLGNGDVILYDAVYDAKTNPYRSISKQTTYAPIKPGSQIYQIISQTTFIHNLNGQLRASSTIDMPQDSKTQPQKTITQHTYDALGRLISSDKTGQIQHASQYVYDANGNMRHQTGSHTSVDTYNGLDQVVKINSMPLDYDNNGNQYKSIQNGQYHFNARNQLVDFQTTENTALYQYSYYPSGYRADKKLNHTQLAFYYAGAALLNTLNVTTQQYAHYLLADGRFYRHIEGQPTHDHYELLGHQGSITGSLNTLGHLSNTQHFGAYGTLLSATQHNQNAPPALTLQTDPYGYDGAYHDTENGLLYLHARYYNPNSLRFISQDSVPLMNRYAFAKGDPVDRMDPSGHQSILNNPVFAAGIALTGWLGGIPMMFGFARTGMALTLAGGAVSAIYSGLHKQWYNLAAAIFFTMLTTYSTYQLFSNQVSALYPNHYSTLSELYDSLAPGEAVVMSRSVKILGVRSQRVMRILNSDRQMMHVALFAKDDEGYLIHSELWSVKNELGLVDKGTPFKVITEYTKDEIANGTAQFFKNGSTVTGTENYGFYAGDRFSNPIQIESQQLMEDKNLNPNKFSTYDITTQKIENGTGVYGRYMGTNCQNDVMAQLRALGADPNAIDAIFKV